MVLRPFSPARAWRPAVVTRLARTLGLIGKHRGVYTVLKGRESTATGSKESASSILRVIECPDPINTQVKRIPPKLQPWFEARQRLRLSHASIQMARELGMNPKKLGKLVPAKGEQWKAPLPEFIAHCYEKSHGRRSPEKIRSLEQVIEDDDKRKEARRARKAANSDFQATSEQPSPEQAREHEA